MCLKLLEGLLHFRHIHAQTVRRTGSEAEMSILVCRIKPSRSRAKGCCLTQSDSFCTIYMQFCEPKSRCISSHSSGQCWPNPRQGEKTEGRALWCDESLMTCMYNRICELVFVLFVHSYIQPRAMVPTHEHHPITVAAAFFSIIKHFFFAPWGRLSFWYVIYSDEAMNCRPFAGHSRPFPHVCLWCALFFLICMKQWLGSRATSSQPRPKPYHQNKWFPVGLCNVHDMDKMMDTDAIHYTHIADARTQNITIKLCWQRWRAMWPSPFLSEMQMPKTQVNLKLLSRTRNECGWVRNECHGGFARIIHIYYLFRPR